MPNQDDITTERVPKVEDPTEVLADAAFQLGRLGDVLHELRQQVDRTRRRLIASREGRPFEE